MHEGHRKRMIQRLENGGAGLQDHELLEILLFGVIPRKNTNGVAHNLLNAFGTLEGVFSAGREQLMAVDGIGESAAAHLRCVGLCLSRVRTTEEPPPTAFNVETFSTYLIKRFAPLKEEVIEIYCLDAYDRIKQSKRFTSGDRCKVSVEPDDVLRFVVASAPKGLILAHNHPAAPNSPTKEDDRFTAQVQLVCSMNNIKLYDHIIVGNNGAYSYHLVGRLDDIKTGFHVSTVLGEKGLL